MLIFWNKLIFVFFTGYIYCNENVLINFNYMYFEFGLFTMIIHI